MFKTIVQVDYNPPNEPSYRSHKIHFYKSEEFASGEPRTEVYNHEQAWQPGGGRPNYFASAEIIGDMVRLRANDQDTRCYGGAIPSQRHRSVIWIPLRDCVIYEHEWEWREQESAG